MSKESFTENMNWSIEIKMFGPDQTTWYWSQACVVWSTEMLGIVERALQHSGQQTRSFKQ
jgi:hypothetical protein